MNALTDKVIIDKLVEASKAGVKNRTDHPWNLLPDSGRGRIYGKYPGDQYCRTVFRAFQNISVWSR